MNINLFVSSAHTQKKHPKNLKTCINVNKSVHSVLFWLCVLKNVIFKQGSFWATPQEWYIYIRQQKITIIKKIQIQNKQVINPSSVSQRIGIHSSAWRAAKGHLVKTSKQNTSSLHFLLYIFRGKNCFVDWPGSQNTPLFSLKPQGELCRIWYPRRDLRLTVLKVQFSIQNTVQFWFEAPSWKESLKKLTVVEIKIGGFHHCVG